MLKILAITWRTIFLNIGGVMGKCKYTNKEAMFRISTAKMSKGQQRN